MATLNVSGKYKHIISNSTLIRSGRPAVYQLRTNKDTFGSLTRTTVGEKDVNKINKTILLVGETGAGKSSLVNVLVNYSMGVKWEDGVWFQMVEEEEGGQTSDVMVYQIFGFKGKTLPYSLTIIDTPGFGDTRGIEHDVAISQGLLDLFRSGDAVHEINAVGLVMKASENRVSGRLMYVYNSVTSLFGKNLEKNIVALITHSDGRKPKNALQALEVAKIEISKNEKNQPVYFLFNNCQQEDRTREEEEPLKADYQISKSGMKTFTDFLEKTGPQKVGTTTEVLSNRIGLTACIQNLQDRIQTTEEKQTEIRQIQKALKMQEEEKKRREEKIKKCEKAMTKHDEEINKCVEEKKNHDKEMKKLEDKKRGHEEIKKKYDEEMKKSQEALKKHEEEMEKNKNFTVEVDEVYKEKEAIDGGWRVFGGYRGAVSCPVCQETCHHPGCTITPSAGLCEVMKDGRCTVCTRKCPASVHVKDTWKYVAKTRRVKKTLEDVKKKYEDNEKQLKKQLSRLTNCEEQIGQLMEKSRLQEAAYQKSKTEQEDLSTRLENLEEEKKRLTSEMSQLLNEADKKTENQNLSTPLESLHSRSMEKLENLKEEMKKLRSEKSELLDEAYQHVIRLQQIALKVDSVSTYVHLDFLIEKMKENGDTEKVQKLEEMKGRMDEGTRAALDYRLSAQKTQ